MKEIILNKKSYISFVVLNLLFVLFIYMTTFYVINELSSLYRRVKDMDNNYVYISNVNVDYYYSIDDINNSYKYDICYKEDGKTIYGALIIRKKLSDFIQLTKNFCKFHISTLGFENYGKEIKKILQQEFDCDFIKFQAKDPKIGKKKFLKNLELNIKDTLIFDDNPNIWIKDNKNVIISKKFIDKDNFLRMVKHKFAEL